MTARRVLILGAAGRDFHNFNVVYRDDRTVTVVAFTAAQIPGIADVIRRRWPDLTTRRESRSRTSGTWRCCAAANV
jgi:predicted GTPase